MLGREKLSFTLLDSVIGGLEIKLTKDRLRKRKHLIMYI